MRVQPRETEPVEEVRASGPWGTIAMTALLVWAGVALGIGVVVMIVALVFMIFMHELGHYVTARWAGMKVTEFFIGFGPRIWSFHRGETEYGVKAIQAGAYVRIIGMSNLEEVDPADEDRTYRSKPYGRRLSVAVAGSTMHFLMALVLIFVVFAGFGVQEESSWRIGTIAKPSAAFDAGLQPEDRIVAVDGERFEDFSAMSEYLRAHPGEEVELDVVRGGDELSIEATLGRENPAGEKVGFLGVGPTFPYERVSPSSAVVRSLKEFGSVAKGSVLGLAHIFSPSGVRGYVDTIVEPDADGVGGADISEDRPTSVVGIVNIGNQVAQNGIVNVLYLLFGVNIFIGIFNLLPLLPFDGGHVVIATYEKLRSMRSGRRYQADVAKMLPITYVVVVVLALLFVTSLYLDIAHPVSVR